MERDKEKICRNCKHFVKHYTGNSNVQFVFADNVCTVKMPIYVKEDHYCGYWERKEKNADTD